MSHLSEGEIERFLKARAAPAERQRVVRHLLAGCSVCRRKLAEKAPGPLLAEDGERHRGRQERRKLDRSLEIPGPHPDGYGSVTSRRY